MIVPLPDKQHVVCAQIRDAKNDAMMIRLKMPAAAGHVKVIYHDRLKLDWKV